MCGSMILILMGILYPNTHKLHLGYKDKACVLSTRTTTKNYQNNSNTTYNTSEQHSSSARKKIRDF